MHTFRIVVVGCGKMSDTWIRYALNQEDLEIVALVDIKKEFAVAAAERHGLVCNIYTDLTQAITESGANVVFDVTIPTSHYEVGRTALLNGCSVFAEKPMAATMEEARRLIALTEETGHSLAIMQNRRFDPNVRALRELIQIGTIGRIGCIAADFYLSPRFGGFREVMDSPLILDMAIHTFDQARLISGADAVSVYCHEFNPPGSWYKGNAAAICIFEMSDGSVFSYHGSWCAIGAPTSWQAAWRVVGEMGTAIWDGDSLPYAEVAPASEQPDSRFKEVERIESIRRWHGQASTGHDGCLDEMFASLRESRPAETDCKNNIKSMAMVLGAIESARTGQKVSLN